ncbi:hypothetical protein Poli38472_010531 [Pythium oligandrum]|uniref:Protein kinase domain-containing protein n=1 Tax=Pythium oligandrum TaxID=41045 RepID=A0A8K1FCA9_PYTOL|nr:hypothetical protein Poli38472_010531 [Pythium oligandrum]|eukprot:TMW55649.1 hypothetical protein Poli38472_010531 [Pythium oligandrum]
MSQFLKEIDLWYTLHHPNVVKMFGACHVSSPPLIVCEDATNGNLADFLASSDGGIRHMWRLLLEVALGLEYLHRNQVVHGDLNLNNLLVGSDGAARVADFGLSIIGSTGSSFSATDGSGGGLRWRAPECLKQRPTFESDVYSLAICMIEAVSGEPPYSLEDDVTVQKLVLSGQLPTRPTQMSDEAWKLVVSMTTFDPSKRFRLTDAISRVKLLAENDCENATWSPGNTTHEAEKPDQHTQPSRGNEKTDTYAESYPLSEETGSDGAVDVRSVELTIVPASNTNQHFSKEIIHLNSRLTMRELMVSSLENGSPQEKYAALKWLYRKATDEAESQHIKQAGGHQLAFKCLQDPSLAVYHHVYGFGVLYRMYIAHAISYTDFKVVEEKVCTLRVYKEAELKEMLFPRNEGEAAEKVALIQKWESYKKDSSPFIPALVTMLRTVQAEEEEESVLALGTFADLFSNVHFCWGHHFKFDVLIAPATEFVKSGTELQKASATGLLRILVYHRSDYCPEIKAAAVLEPLVKVIQTPTNNPKFHSDAMFVLGALARKDPATRSELIKLKPFGTLVQFVQKGLPSQKEDAANALGSLMKSAQGRREGNDKMWRPSEPISAIYALVSGTQTPASDKKPGQGRMTAIINRKPLQPPRFSGYQAHQKLRSNEELPELLEALYTRNQNWSRLSTPATQSKAIQDEELYLPPPKRSRRFWR